MVSVTYHLNVPTTKYRYRLPITTPPSATTANTDYMKMSVLAPKGGSTTVGTLSLRLEVRAAQIDRGGGQVFSLANVEVSILATNCTLQSPSAGGQLDAQLPKVTWKEASLDLGDNKDYSVDFTWPKGKRSFDFVLKADELERYGVISNVRVVLP